MGGFLGWVFVSKFKSHPPYPQKDPRLLEAMGVGMHEDDDDYWAHTPEVEGEETSGAATTTGGRP
jgi:hypothetical protein